MEQKLKNLGQVQINERLMETDYEQITQRLQLKKHSKWQIPFTVLACITLFFVLLATSNLEPNKVTSTVEHPSLPITKAYYSIVNDVEPISNFYPYVYKAESGVLNGMNELLQIAEWKYIGEVKADLINKNKMKFVFEDGSTKVFQNYVYNNEEYLYDDSTGYGFVIINDGFGDSFQLEMIRWRLNDNKSFWYYFIVSIPLLLRLFLNRAYKKETGIHKIPDYRSNPWQGISALVIYGVLFFFTIYNKELHIGWCYLGIILNVILFRLLDNRFDDHHHWRIRNDLISNLMVALFVTLILYNIV